MRDSNGESVYLIKTFRRLHSRSAAMMTVSKSCMLLVLVALFTTCACAVEFHYTGKNLENTNFPGSVFVNYPNYHEEEQQTTNNGERIVYENFNIRDEIGMRLCWCQDVN
ncbi:hypothetical protein O3G_MSEX008977 [Manduca sexta]|uniref:Uncharacterized protein n=1 Tax=Manduca sexta TaxID=7130 RepID=A0A921ZBW4_MANSE|nr:hypothetical protein O3G_MSEX008977 [Manduca sexta]